MVLDTARRRVNTIDQNSTVKESRKLRDDNDADFLIVTRNGHSAYILKKYQTILEKKNATIASIAGKLKATVVVESGSQWDAVSPRLYENAVLVVADTKAQKTNIIGTISVYDMKWRKL
ncbi:MAG: hypothetical protein JSW53_03145 [Candidatus Bathyarchaeota archaeon]|nr:MAG: hypothetical protein JSW53_03145 [Candidatus Bathyarchaeota archaeon]